MSGSAAFEYEIRVGWADCDPANIAYTGRLPDFALEAIDAWWEHVVGDDWFALHADRQLGTPFVNMSLDFRSPVTPRFRLRCRVSLVRLGRTSITFKVSGYQADTLCFEGSFTEVFMRAGEFKAVPPPDDIRSLVEAHLETAA